MRIKVIAFFYLLSLSPSCKFLHLYFINIEQVEGDLNEIIPYGWEKVEDPEYGTFYIE